MGNGRRRRRMLAVGRREKTEKRRRKRRRRGLVAWPRTAVALGSTLTLKLPQQKQGGASTARLYISLYGEIMWNSLKLDLAPRPLLEKKNRCNIMRSKSRFRPHYVAKSPKSRFPDDCKKIWKIKKVKKTRKRPSKTRSKIAENGLFSWL